MTWIFITHAHTHAQHTVTCLFSDFFFTCLFCFGSFPHDVFFKSLISFAYFCTQLPLHSSRCTELVVSHTLLKDAWRKRGPVQTRCITVQWHNSTPYCREWMCRKDLVLTDKTASRFSYALKVTEDGPFLWDDDGQLAIFEESAQSGSSLEGVLCSSFICLSVTVKVDGLLSSWQPFIAQCVWKHRVQWGGVIP